MSGDFFVEFAIAPGTAPWQASKSKQRRATGGALRPEAGGTEGLHDCSAEQHAILLQQTLFGFKKPPLSDLTFSVKLTYMGNPWVISSCYQRLRCFDQLGQPLKGGSSMAPWLSHLPTLAKAIGAVQLSFSSQWITSTLYSPGRFWLPFEAFFLLLRSRVHQVKKTEIPSDIPTSLYKEGWFVMFIIFLLCFCQLSSLLGTPSPFANFCQEVSDLNLHRPATEAGKA